MPRALNLRQRRSGCPISVALELLGDAWSLLIVRDLMFKERRTFNDFLTGGEGIASNILADRLRKLADETPAPAGYPSRNEDSRPAAGVLSDATRENLERLAREADEVNDRLAACQRRLDL